ncbi:MAG TPA: endolytic transglycosylase MltG [Oscillospiraceae bacterium]|nr:endolytic transglycosylase MltG [Oscillospiraceae bacterium]
MLDDKPQNNSGDLPHKRAESFQLHISEEDLNGTSSENLYSDDQSGNMDDTSTLRSYSTPPESRTGKPTPQQKEEEKQMKKAQKYRNKQKGSHNRHLFRILWIFMVVIIAIGLAQFLLTGLNDMLAVGRSQLTVSVEIPKNPTTKQIADILYNDGVISNASFFQLYSKLTKADGHYTNGTYKVQTNMDYEALINNLQASDNRVDSVKVTIPEGMNIVEIGALLEKNGVCTSKELLAAANSAKLDDYSLIKSITNDSDRYYKVEGYLFPDTYEFYKSDNPENVLGKMIYNGSKKLTKTVRDKAAAKKMSVDQLLTLASIIQAESADESDMYNISSILQNRLKDGKSHDIYHLECDSTKYYPYRQKSLVPSNLTNYVSKYDTYTLPGLPAGPICNPGEKAIDAVLNPNSTDFYYFCHDSNKKPYYASSLSVHKRNLKSAGITK